MGVATGRPQPAIDASTKSQAARACRGSANSGPFVPSAGDAVPDCLDHVLASGSAEIVRVEHHLFCLARGVEFVVAKLGLRARSDVFMRRVIRDYASKSAER